MPRLPHGAQSFLQLVRSQGQEFESHELIRRNTMIRSCICGFAILIALSGVVSTAAGEFVIGRYAGEFLELGAGARALAMGGASVARPLPATAGYYNPSALAGLNSRQLEFMHSSQFDNLFTYDYLSFAQPMQGGLSGSITIM
jgi:hypothetical protein